MRHVLCAVLVTALVFMIKLTPLTLLGLNYFGVINLIYVDLMVLPPAAAVVLLGASCIPFREGRRVTVSKPARIFAVGAFALMPIGVYASWIEPFRLQLESTQVPIAPARQGKAMIRVGVIADLQTSRITDYERSAIDRLMSLRPDLILMPGDLFQGSGKELEANRSDLIELLSRLSAPGGVYFVLGDVDQGHYQLEEILQAAGIGLLVNEVTRIKIGDQDVTIGGVELDPSTGRARETIQTLETEPGDGDIRILVAHRPDVALGLKRRSRIDLTVAGHTHGGQIVIPGFGPPMTLSRVPRPVAAGGLHALVENRLYVSRGVGCERGQAPRIRFFCPPEISLLELTHDSSK
ncbi:metallophosphoesterase [Singulisphaera sp. Ch08]|uniref:Metallophosphoesterase n=1 Tax=Singulisphaera sp. Ch08 TaxID=3120278 RepID=A0AAU7CD61_9BACT